MVPIVAILVTHVFGGETCVVLVVAIMTQQRIVIQFKHVSFTLLTFPLLHRVALWRCSNIEGQGGVGQACLRSGGLIIVFAADQHVFGFDMYLSDFEFLGAAANLRGLRLINCQLLLRNLTLVHIKRELSWWREIIDRHFFAVLTNDARR